MEVVIHSYRHRHNAAPGDPALAAIEAALAARPVISVPTVNLHGLADGVGPPAAVDPDREKFSGPYRRVLIEGAGHFLPQEAPRQYVEAILGLAEK